MNQEKIGKFISDCRKEKQLTQEQLAVLLGVTSKSISKWETGNCLPDASKYKTLCEILGITVNDLFSGERLSSETENEAKDYLVDLLASRIYDVDCGVSYEDFKNALLRMSETTVMLSKFKSKEDAVEYLAKETGLTFEECSNAYDFYFNLYKIKKSWFSVWWSVKFQFDKGGVELKRTIRDNINPPYTLHDMNVISFEVTDNDIVMRTQSGMVETTTPCRQLDGYVEFHNVQWDFSYVYMLGVTGNVGTFTGEKLFLKDFIERYKQFGFSIMDETYGYNQTKYNGYLLANRQYCECVVEIYHEGDMVFVTVE